MTLSLKEALGAERFIEYQKSQDPKYRVLLSAGNLYGIPSANVEKAYAIDSDAAAKIALMLKQNPVLSFSSRKTIEELRAAQSAKLKELLGAEASDFFACRTVTLATAPSAATMGAPIMVRPGRQN